MPGVPMRGWTRTRAHPRQLLITMMHDDRSYFWNRLDRTSSWVMPPGIRAGWVRTLDGLLVHIDAKNVLRSISGMHWRVVVEKEKVDSVGIGVLLDPLGG